MTAIWEIDDGEEEVPGLDADGRPDPAYAARLGLIRAPFPRRALSVLIDVVVYLLVQLPLWLFAMPLVFLYLSGSLSLYGFVTHPSFLLAAIMAGATVLLTLVLGIVQFVLHGRKGTTIGKSVFGLRSVHVAKLGRPGFWRVVLRSIIVAASGLVVVGPLVMVLSPLWDSERRGRGWHDHATRVWLIDVRGGLDPYDDKRMRVARKAAEAAEIAERPGLPSLATSAASGTAPEYRPAARVSAGVLGVARTHADDDAPPVGLPDTVAPPPATARDAAPQVVLGVPTNLRGAPPERPTPRMPDRVESEPAPSAPSSVAPPPLPQASPPQPSPQPEATPPQPGLTPPAPEAASPDASVPPAPPVPPRPPAPPEGVLVLDTGQRIRVAGRVLLGRDPQARADIGDARLIAIPDETRSISKTHLSLRVTELGVELSDLGSTNGTEIERDGQSAVVAPGAPVLAARGDTVRFGDRTFVIHLSTTDRLA